MMKPRHRYDSRPQQFKVSIWWAVLLLLVGWLAVLYSYHSSTFQQITQEGLHLRDQILFTTQQSAPVVVTTTSPVVEMINTVQRSEVKAQPALHHEASSSKMHLVFSTDCSFFQDWQTLLFFHSAVQVGQEGDITRIASGCAEERRDELHKLYQQLYPQYRVHFTPDFKMDNKTKKKYDFYNKPYGLHHWLQHADPPVADGTVVILLDPDMILLRPLTLQLAGYPTNIFFDKKIDPKDPNIPKQIGKGVPVATIYGLGAPWAEKNHPDFDRVAVCGQDSPCTKVNVRDAELHYSVGPPYFLEKTDLLAVTQSWTEFVPRVYERYPDLLAEMYAYSMAAAHNNLPHYIMRHYMVSNIDMDAEGWAYVDALGDNVCEPAVNGIYYPDMALPNVLHYCQFYRVGELGFQKRRVKKSLFDCDQPLMAVVPKDQGKLRYKNRDGEIMEIGAKRARRGSFMLSVIHKTLNDMVRHYRSKMCPAGSAINFEETLNLVEKSNKPKAGSAAGVTSEKKGKKGKKQNH